MQDRAANPLKGTRIVVVCAHFAPEIGYQEVDLARAFTRLGADVRVITTTRLSPNARTLLDRDYEAGVARHEGYEILRLTPHLTVGPNVLGPDVRPAVADFGPDYVILVGPGKLFGLELFSSKPQSWKRIAIIQDNSEDSGARARSRGRLSVRGLAHRVVKRPAYRRVVRNAEEIVFNVPESHGLVERWLGRRDRELLQAKAVDLRLGFDPEQFFFDPTARRNWRVRHDIDETDVLLGTCTRAVPSKRLEAVIDAVSELRAQGLPVKYVLAGVLEDRYGESLRNHAQRQRDPTAFHILPAVNREAMRELLCACDLGYWSQAAITIQQAMGTGLPLVLQRRPTVSHLLAPGRSGWYAEADDALCQTLATAVASVASANPDERSARRLRTVNTNSAYLSYDVIAAEIIRSTDRGIRRTDGELSAPPAPTTQS